MDVFVVEESCASESWIRGAFSTLELAHSWSTEHQPQGGMAFIITRMTVDTPDSNVFEGEERTASVKD
jgi:hypothetical protein